MGFQLLLLYRQEDGKGPIILFCCNMRSRLGKCSETLDKISSTICFDLRLYRCLDLADLHASAQMLAERCLENLQIDRWKILLKEKNHIYMTGKELEQASILPSPKAGWALSTPFLAGNSASVTFPGYLCYHSGY